jgi:glycine/D-amino acid oxidase-like deaminating enzyme
MPTPLQDTAPRCLYLDTARPYVPSAPLDRDIRVEVAIVGGGYTGLSTALHLAERGHAVALLEAREPGWGAAGRNGGQVNAGLKHEPDTVERDLGTVYGSRLVRLAGEGPDLLFRLIERLQIQCEAHRAGTLRVVYQPRHADWLRASVGQWQRRGVALELWDGPRVAAATGTGRYLAAAFDPRGGSVNPLGLARGLAAAAIRAGCSLHDGTPALRLERQGNGWCVVTPRGRVCAGSLVLATDGYSDDLWPGLRTSVVPIYSAIIATAPLPAALVATILPGGESAYESGNSIVYYRRTPDNRLLMGGRGPQRDATERGDYAHLVRYAGKLWPALAAIEWTHWWNGQFALTPDFYPRLHAPAPNLFIGLGYSGRGVALGVAMGAELAAAASGAPLDSLALPVTGVRRIPFHRFWRAGVAGRLAYARLLDRIGR